MTFLIVNKNNFYTVTNRFRRHQTYPEKEDSKLEDWLFVLHTLNFSLWNSKGTKQWTVDGSKGYCALCIAIKRAIDVSTMLIYLRMT